MERPPGRTVVLEEDDRILGSAKMGPNRPGPGDHIGTGSFVVDPAARGRGVGRALAEQVVQWHRDEGYRGIQFSAVVETNVAALRLWQPSASRSSARCRVPSARPRTGTSACT